MKDEATPEMIEMARRIAREALPPPSNAIHRSGAYLGALAAIIETQLLIRDWLTAQEPTGLNDRDFEIAAAIRAGHHYRKDGG